MKRMLQRPACLLGLFAVLSAPAMAANTTQSIGTNINSIRNWITSVPFVDLFKSANPFPTTAGVVYDDRGWPTGLPAGVSVRSVIAVNELTPVLPAGNYVVTYEGTGSLGYGGAVTVVEQGQGRDVIHMDPTSRSVYLYLDILSSSYSDPVRNIHVTLPGGICADDPQTRVEASTDCVSGNYLSFEDHHDQIIFNPPFLEFASQFRALRYMDFMDTNNSTVSSWEDRTRLDDAVWTGGAGAPVEVMVALANRADANPWFTMPHLADDNYVRQFAAYVRDNLDSNLSAYVEYSNEVWSDTAQGLYAKNTGQSLGLSTDWNQAGARYYSQRSVEIFNLWQQQFGSLDRLVRVLSGQMVNTWLSEQILTWQNAYQSADIMAMNLYVSGSGDSFRSASSVADVFAEMRGTDRLALAGQIDYTRQQAAVAARYGLQLATYEGGQGLVDWTTTSNGQYPNNLFYAANRDAQMKSLYLDMLSGWKNAGGTLFMSYAAPRHFDKAGSWGISEYLGQPRSAAPKYDALLTYMSTTSCWWAGCVGNADSQDVTDAPTNSGGSDDSTGADTGNTDTTDTDSSGSSTDTSETSSVAVTFNQLALNDYGNVSTGGYNFSSERVGTLSIIAVDDRRVLSPRWGDVMRLQAADGSSFSLSSFDLKGRWSGLSSQVDITATFRDGRTETRQAAYNGDSWSTVALNWTGLASLTFSTPTGRAMFDRFVFSTGSSSSDSSGSDGSSSDADNTDTSAGTETGSTSSTVIGFDYAIAGDYAAVASSGYQFSPTVKPAVSLVADSEGYALSPYWGERMMMRRTDQRSFDLSSFNYKGRWSGLSGTLLLTAVLSDGTEKTRSLSYNATAWQSVTLNWNDVVSLTFGTPDGRAMLDNFAVNP